VVLHAGGVTDAAGVVLAADGKSLSLTPAGGAGATLPLDTVVAAVRRIAPREPRMPTGAGRYFAELLSGERIRLEELKYDGQNLQAEHFYFGPLTWPKRKVKRIVAADDVGREEPPGFVGVVLRNGDRTEGTVRTIEPRQALVEMPGVGDIPLTDLGAVRSFVLNPRLAGRRRQFFSDAPSLELLLKSGEVFAVALAGVAPDGLNVKSEWMDKPVALPAQFVRAYAVHGAVVYLADLPPATQTVEPYLGFALPWKSDTSLLERPLRSGSICAHRGVALHARTTLEYKLAALTAGPLTLVGLAGIDAEIANVNAGAELRMALDGREVLNETLAAGAEPKPFRIAIPAGAATLSVVADFGRLGSVGDHVDLLYAGFVRAKAYGP
jgi:hypothetical protein